MPRRDERVDLGRRHLEPLAAAPRPCEVRALSPRGLPALQVGCPLSLAQRIVA
jgi:hypothetical protein